MRRHLESWYSSKENPPAYKLTVDFEPAHPKMGSLVNEAAHRGVELLRQKRSRLSK